jgi:ketosteroid isomerase-like protein
VAIVSNALTDSDAIAKIIERINEAWRAKRYDEIGTFVAEDVVIAPPGSPNRICGRDAYVKSYREYDATATTLEFTTDSPLVDIVADVAVAVTAFRVAYQLGQEVYHESGRDLLVFGRTSAGWRVVWRSMVTDPAS